MTRIDVSRPQFDQNSYWGRARHFFQTTNPLNLFVSSNHLHESREIVRRLKRGEDVDLSEEQLWRHKQIYDSAFHPETEEKMILFGRMSAQVPMNMAITGCESSRALPFPHSRPLARRYAHVLQEHFGGRLLAVVQSVLQRCRQLHEPKRRHSAAPLVSPLQLATAYSVATGGALATALSLNRLAKAAPPVVGRFVPFLAVSAANCVNIPLMRFQELRDGLQVVDQSGAPVGKSRTAAQWAIAQVVFSRIAMAAPGMTLPPLLMDRLERRGVLSRMPWISAPLQVVLCGLFLTFTTPMCCALFPQTSSLDASSLEPEIAALLAKNGSQKGFYNKGL
ncbi:unnamed protein product [Oppiella nova]|uniref:Sidoreflexin n=1 Tax=Oppiella nova TaxID=334625 RepID=A0A7R9QDD8_9ACAR|nr:unnamed protein product [Oppiella nova]CAG2163651.1 unnamed protein product [Oppiella nova]